MVASAPRREREPPQQAKGRKKRAAIFGRTAFCFCLYLETCETLKL
jgi:hypothetical protein